MEQQLPPSSRERNLQHQVRELQAALPQLQLDTLQANTARDQAEATLRSTNADYNAFVLDVEAASPPGSPSLTLAQQKKADRDI